MYFHIYKDRQGLWRWYFSAANGRKIADSAEGYYNKQDCLHAINIIRQNANTAPVYEQN